MSSFSDCAQCGAWAPVECTCNSSSTLPPPSPPPSTAGSRWSFPSGFSHFASTPTHSFGHNPPASTSPGSSTAPSVSPSAPYSHGSGLPFHSPYPMHGPPGGVSYSHSQYPPPGTPFYTVAGYPPPMPPPTGPIDLALLQTPGRPPLEDSTPAVVNANGKRTLNVDPRGGAPKRGRGSCGSAARGRGRGRGRGKGGPAPPIAIGPSTPGEAAVAPLTVGSSSSTPEPVQPAPLLSFGSVIRKTSSQGPGPSSQSSVSDVWFNVYSLQGSRDGLSVADLPVNQPRMYDKPSDQTCDFVACRFCKDRIHTWLCKNGMTAAIREHHQSYHWPEWRKSVIDNQLKGWEELAFKPLASGTFCGPSAPHAESSEPFTEDGLGRRIVRWIVGDDQAINVVESDLFREIVRYASRSPVPLEDEDILHRMHAHTLIVDEYQKTIKALRKELESTDARVSFTCDMWTCKILRGYMAVTVHFRAKNCDQKLELHSRLGAFRYIPGRHTGANMATQFLTILEELDILNKIGCITLDNASNCDTMMEDLERLLAVKGIAFSCDGNRIRCFPHVVNISVKHGLKALTEAMDTAASTMSQVDPRPPQPNPTTSDVQTQPQPAVFKSSEADEEAALLAEALEGGMPSNVTAEDNLALQADEDYANALADDPIKRARQLVAACHVSSLRCEAFEAAITEAKAKGKLPQDLSPNTQLLRDVDTWWSSVLFMIDRVLELNPAAQIFFDKDEQEDISHPRLNTHHLRVLNDIRDFLRIPYQVQQILSSTNTPTAPLILPTYEKFLTLLKLVRNKYSKIAHAISASIAILELYMTYTRRTQVYALAMVINPTAKFYWVIRTWPEEEQCMVKAWLIKAVFEHRKDERLRTQALEATASETPAPSSSSAPGASHLSRTLDVQLEAPSALAQQSGFELLEALHRELSMSSVDSADETHASQSSAESEEAREECLDAEDMKAAEREVDQYLREELASPNTNILEYWEHREHTFPFLYHVALPLLSAQASGVTSERVFSSSKKTDTLRRTSMSAATMEVLQVLKYSIREGQHERERSSGFTRSRNPSVDRRKAEVGAGFGPALSEGDNFSPGRMSDVLRAIREDGTDESLT